MRLVRTTAGLARVDGDQICALDLPYASWSEAFADGADATGARVTSRHPLLEDDLKAPIADPGTLVICGFNFRAHLEEMGQEPPKRPPMGQTTAMDRNLVVGPNDPILLPAEAPDRVDYEGEIGVVIGRHAFQVEANKAWEHVAGLIVVNDVSERSGQAAAMAQRGDWGRYKAFPTFKPVGAYLVTPDEFDFAPDLELRTLVNGDQRQIGRSGDFLFSIPELIQWATRKSALEPGDLLCTGTPGGVGLASETFLAPGDVVEVRVERLGATRNVVAAPAGRPD